MQDVTTIPCRDDSVFVSPSSPCPPADGSTIPVVRAEWRNGKAIEAA